MLNKTLKKIGWKTFSGRWDTVEIGVDVGLFLLVIVLPIFIYLIRS